MLFQTTCQPDLDSPNPRPSENRFAVLWGEDDQKYFPIRADAIRFAEALIEKAKDEADVDGYPRWFCDVMILEIVATVRDSTDGQILVDHHTGRRVSA